VTALKMKFFKFEMKLSVCSRTVNMLGWCASQRREKVHGCKIDQSMLNNAYCSA